MPDAQPRSAIIGTYGAVAYMASVAFVAQITGLAFLLFPELGALAYDIFKRPAGTWARAPIMLVLTPSLTAIAGILLTRHLAYGPVAVMLAVGSALLVMRILRSPIAPAISAGLLPVTLGVTDWRYPVAVLASTALLAAIATARSRNLPINSKAADSKDRLDDSLEEHPASYAWVPWYLGFLGTTLALVSITGWRFVLFPPLVVIGFEMFAHADICPWARQPLRLPLACALTATAGLLAWTWLGTGPLAAALAVLLGAGVLRLVRLHVPPAVAVGLLPMVMTQPRVQFVLAVAIGTTLLTITFLAYRGILMRSRPVLDSAV